MNKNKYIVARCLDCGHTGKCKVVWRKYDSDKETIANVCLYGCFNKTNEVVK